MKNKTYRIVRGAVAVVIVAGLVFLDAVGAFTVLSHSLSAKRQEDLSFSFKSCDDDGEYVVGEVSQAWNDETLEVNGVVSHNCGATWLFGAYERSGNKLSLKYSPVLSRHFRMACICQKQVQYKIMNLEKVDYEISISHGEVIEYNELIPNPLILPLILELNQYLSQ
jgi:hypothetical protein